jgi:cytochrome c556
MKSIIPAIIVAIVALALAAPAQPAAPTNAQLARQIKTLQKQVKTLQKQVKEAKLFAAVAVVYSGCSVAVTADAFEGTWSVVDQVNGSPIFGPQVPVTDYEACKTLEITRAPTQVPPNVSVFNSLLALLK